MTTNSPLMDTKSIKVVVITERWSNGWTRDDGKKIEPGWQKPKGWPARGSQRPDGDLNSFSSSAKRAYHVCSLHRALTIRSKTPAFFVGYQPNTIGLRLRKDALSPLFSSFTEDGGGVRMHLALFDVDNHDEGADIEAWFDAELGKIGKFQEAHPGMIVYRSRRGYRIIGLLPEALHIKDSLVSAKWDRQYAAWCNYLTRVFSIKADVLLDWTRFQAIPHTKKDRNLPALELEVFGSVDSIGAWNPALVESDFPLEKKSGSYDGANYEGECQLLQLVQLEGLRCEATEYANVYDICCPNWSAHSPDSRGLQDYPTKTVLYTNGPIGKIECKSSGCQASHPDRNTDYFRHFPTINVERTRPKPPIDVWDEDVLNFANRRNAMCSRASLESYLQAKCLLDDEFDSYHTALRLQKRLERK